MTNFLKIDIGSTQNEKNDTDMRNLGVILLFRAREPKKKTTFFNIGG